MALIYFGLIWALSACAFTTKTSEPQLTATPDWFIVEKHSISYRYFFGSDWD
jgi:hypothetical protein